MDAFNHLLKASQETLCNTIATLDGSETFSNDHWTTEAGKGTTRGKRRKPKYHRV